jgi:hypothetical protein
MFFFHAQEGFMKNFYTSLIRHYKNSLGARLDEQEEKSQ